MRKVILLATVSSILAGCAPSYVRDDVKTLDDSALCSRIGYAQAAGKMEAFKTGYNEINNREKNGSLTIALGDCKAFVQMGAIEAAKDAQSERDAAATTAVQMQNMQAQHNFEMQRLQQQASATTTTH
ncbi:hypothetical protein CR62_24110 [Serratia grimesii]|uniref:Lipoprotein n=1 Tax=Serratia grimesii TaxID=82995 RepID=A0ABR4UAN6_9GAMM|nr:hypothetical protein CR62_24110 [Serratia grimesii]